MVINIVQTIVLLMLLSDLIVLCLVISKRWNYKGPRKINTNNKLVVIVAALYEQKIIADTIQYLSRNLYDKVDQIIIVGNMKERDKSDENPTLNMARKEVKELNKFTVVECPYSGAIKAHQVNYAQSLIEYEPSTTWVYLLDVDTRAKEDAVNEVFSSAQKGHTIIQQHSHFFIGYRESNWLGKATAAYQSRWTLVHEIGRIMLFNALNVGVFHLVGHGLCINLEKYRTLGGFSEKFEIEDVHFGYICTFKGERVKSCLSLEGSDCTNNIHQWWWQQYGWSKGVMQAPSYFRDLKIKEGHLSWYNYLQQVYAVWNYVRWVCHSPIIWLVVLFSLLEGSFIFLALFVVLYGVNFVVSGLFFRKKGYYKGSLLAYFGWGFFYALFRSVPVIHGLFDRCIGKNRPKYKTDHGELD